MGAATITGRWTLASVPKALALCLGELSPLFLVRERENKQHPAVLNISALFSLE